jgi:hypothetical protein
VSDRSLLASSTPSAPSSNAAGQRLRDHSPSASIHPRSRAYQCTDNPHASRRTVPLGAPSGPYQCTDNPGPPPDPVPGSPSPPPNRGCAALRRLPGPSLARPPLFPGRHREAPALRPRAGVATGVASAPAPPHAALLRGPAWSPVGGGRTNRRAVRHPPFIDPITRYPARLADPARTQSGPGGNRRGLFLPQRRRQPSALRRCPSPCAHPRGSDRDRRCSADAPRHPSLLPRSPDSTPCRKSARFREPFTPSVAPRRSRLPGRHGSGAAHRGGLHTPANPDRWSTAPVAPGAFPPVPRGPRAAPRSRREAEKTGAVVGAERREQGCDRSKGDARGLENCRRLETSPDPRYQCTDDPRRPPPPGTDDLDGEPPVRARPHGRGPRPPRSPDEAPRVSHRSHFRAAREALGGLRCPSRRRSRSRTTGRSPSRRPKRVPVTDGPALRRARPAARGEGACPRPVGTPRPRAASRGSLTRMHLSDIADRRGPGSPLRSVALASTRPAP